MKLHILAVWQNYKSSERNIVCNVAILFHFPAFSSRSLLFIPVFLYPISTIHFPLLFRCKEQLLRLYHLKFQVLSSRKKEPLAAQAATMSVFNNGWINTYQHSNNSVTKPTHNEMTRQFVVDPITAASAVYATHHIPIPLEPHAPQLWQQLRRMTSMNRSWNVSIYRSLNASQRSTKLGMSQILCWSRVLITRQFRVSLPHHTAT
jgi:hypothetical protein